MSETEAENTEPEAPRKAILVAAFEGWNDAGDAATTAVEHLQLIWDAAPLTELDPDDYYDFQVSRPTVRMVDGITRSIEEPTTRVTHATPPDSETQVLLLHGLEPNMRWRQFCAEIISLAEKYEVSMLVTLGALLADTAHTRPIPVSGAAHDTDSAKRFGLARSEYEGPTGIVGVLQDACVRAGIPAVSFWAAVPHYVSQPPSPKVTIALLRRVEDLLGAPVSLSSLPDQAREWEQTVSEMIAEDEEVAEYVRGLEERGDAEPPMDEVSGDEIAWQVEQYLRRRDE
ncbi:PAC2 family protein [Sciscionella marina]|uniref:PAC2 family protein n=1 Tax=Sciscionella marina TaxID=508770 RepID=UPI000381E829|nr:PAC2 family protein [Sciscionella marina]